TRPCLPSGLNGVSPRIISAGHKPASQQRRNPDPDMTYNQANDLVKKAFGSVRWHNNPMCDGITIPENY
ncbi:hypothetical protein, partial [Mycobacterium marinum]